jgi:alpha-mannosidase
LTLIKSGISPDANADQGRHVFTYSLLPHSGDWRQGRVVEEAYDLNLPLLPYMVSGNEAGRIQVSSDGALPSSYAFAAVDAEHVVLETVKKAEEGDVWIVRLYECQQSHNAAVTLSFGQSVRRAVECNLVEEGEKPVDYQDNRLTFPIGPFEIKTFKVWF